MTIKLQSTITKESLCKDQNGCDDSTLKAMFEDMLEGRTADDAAEISWVDDETVEVKNVSNLSLQKFLVEAERQGKDLTIEKRTFIKIA